MKSLYKIGLAVTLLTTLAGCSSALEDPPVEQAPSNSQVRFNGISADDITIVTDSKTGCKYIYVERGSGENWATATMSPLYVDSTHVDCGQKITTK